MRSWHIGRLMISQSEQIQMHYELGMAIGNSLDLHKMLRTSLTALLRKMNCPAGGVHFFTKDHDGNYQFEKIITIPKKMNRVKQYWAVVKQLPDKLSSRQMKAFCESLPIRRWTEDGGFHIAELPGLGVVVLCRNTELDALTMKFLEPIFVKLAVACRACQQNEELLQHQNNLQAMVKEKTRELR